jgi:hypothetical protein
MKLGVSYNVFDGEELLKGSIEQIRKGVDYISVVYQTKSNFGDEANDTLIELLNDLVEKKLVDEIYEYIPQNIGGSQNEVNKRNIGLELSKKNGCTHHMSMDCDEYYLFDEFENMKKTIIDGDYQASFCQMLSYYKSWEFILDPPETYYVSLIYKIREGVSYVFGSSAPVIVDPTRKLNSIVNPIIFDRSQIQMHHGSYIRNDIRKKLKNSSATNNFNSEIDKIVDHFQNWKYPEQVLWGGKPSKLLNVIKIENKF